MSTSTSRPMTAEEKAHLKDALEYHRKLGGPTSLITFIGLTLLSVASLLSIGLIVWGLALRFLGFELNDFDWRGYMPNWPTIYLIGGIILLFACIPTFREWKRGRKWFSRRERDLLADLDAGIVMEERFQVTGIKRFREPEHLVKYYLLRIADGRVRVVCDFAGTELAEDRGQKALGPRLGEWMTITVFPGSGETRYRFDGEKPKLTRFLEMTAPPDRWPEQDTWCAIRWDELEAYLAGEGK